MSEYTQDGRSIAVETPLEKDELLLSSFEGVEYISSLFLFELTALSRNFDIKPEALIGKQISVTIQNKKDRVFNGFVNRFLFGEVKSNGFREYKFSMVPWLWFLSKTQNHRIFQEKNTKEIVSQVFADLKFKDFEFRAHGGEKREYSLQYGESDLDYISRLLEEEGYAYFFKHEKQKHTLIIVEKTNAYEECRETNLTYAKGSSTDTQIREWEHHYEFRKGVWTLNDYNFKEPKKSLIVEPRSQSKFANNDKFKHDEYPGLYHFGSGNDLVNIRMDAEEVPMNTIKGASNCSTFSAGYFFKLDKHEAKSEKGSYILICVKHSAHDTSYYTGQENATVRPELQTGYSNQFTCIPSAVHFRPIQTHHRPVMKGPQSAIVTGPPGEEIYTDPLGRIKVQFLWDRAGNKDANSSCFLRVMHAWAGNGWGTSFIPRIGHEVIVTFLDGDPDRPIVAGAVYNGINKPPYDVNTQSGIKTRSTKDASAANYNELRFEDKKGSEQIYIHAEKNLDVRVENDATLTVDHDRSKIIKHDENSTIENDRNKTVNNNQTETIKNNKTIDVGKDHNETISANMTIQVEKDLQEAVRGKYLQDVTKEYGLHAKTITVDADDKIIIKTGAAQIVMKSNGDITLSGKTININASANVVIKGSKVITN